MSRKIVLSVLIVTLLGVTGLCALTGYGLYRWVQRNRIGVNILRFENYTAQVTESQTYPLEQTAALEIASDFGDITVTAAEVSEIQVDMLKEAWGASQEEADANAQALAVEARQIGNTLRLTFRQPDQVVIAGSVHARRVDFTVRVPARIAVKLNAYQGEVSLDGLHSQAEIHARFGEIHIKDHTGSLLAESGNGSLTAENILAEGAEIRLLATFGDITARKLQGSRIGIECTNSVVTLDDLTSGGEINLMNSFGPVEVGSFQAQSMSVTNQNGDVVLQTGQVEGALSVDGGFGDVRIGAVRAGETIARTNNGKLELVGVQGRLQLENSFGDIAIEAAGLARLQVKSNNGRIEFSGALEATGEHSVENSFGDVILHLPGNSAFHFDLGTEFGRIDSEFPLTLSGEMSQDQLQGQVNGGGPLLRVSTNNGDIKLLIQPAP